MTSQHHQIEARLSAFDTAMIVVSLVIGIGIFRTPAIVAGRTGSTGLFFAAWILGGAVSLIGALTFMEIGSRFPRAGGYYKVVAHCYHPALAFMLNWAQALMQGAGAAGVATIGAEYLTRLLLPTAERSPAVVQACAMALMLALLALNLLGIRSGARTQNVLSLLKIVMIVGLAIAAFALGRHAAGLPTPSAATGPDSTGPPRGGALGLLAAAVAVFYAYGGYQNTMNFGGDVRAAQRNLPMAVAWGMAIVTGCYLLINAAYHHVLGLDGIAGAQLVAADLARACFGRSGEAVTSAAIFLSAAGFVNATILQVPRSYYAMAQDGAVPIWFLRVNPRTQAQVPGILFFGATMVLPALFLRSFEQLLNYVMFTDALTLALVASTVFVLRRRAMAATRVQTVRSDKPPAPTPGTAEGSPPGGLPFAMPGYPLLPALFMACLLAVAGQVLVSQTGLALWGTALMLAGWPLYRALRALGRRRGAIPPNA